MRSSLLLWLCIGATTVSPQMPNPEERYNYFNIDLLQAINEETDGNVIVSPASAKIALTTILEGTDGRTRQELVSTLRLPHEESAIRSIVGRSLAPLKSRNNGTEIDVATRLWTGSGLQLRDYYIEVLRQFYGGDARPVNFTDTNDTAKQINEWVRRATRDKIQSLAEPGSLDTSTRLLLTSALYFKGQWMKSFDKEATRARCFNVPVRGCKEVPLMESLYKYRYAYVASLDADVLEIPYSDGKTSMLIMLPSNEQNDPYLKILSKDLSYVSMSALLGSLEEMEVFLVLPRFHIESKLDLRSALTRMGVRDIFDLTANFSKLANEQALRVTSILQNVKIEVDEDGTVAAAVTGLSIVPLMGSTVQAFRANRPFFFAIVDVQTNGTLFAGRVIDPDTTNSSIL